MYGLAVIQTISSSKIIKNNDKIKGDEQSGIEVLEMKDPKINKAYPSIPPGTQIPANEIEIVT